MNQVNLSLGEKIKNYRNRAGISQMDLELELDTSAGVISRIESGKVNPTKETIRGIARVLRLTDKELADIFELSSLRPTKEEIEEAVKEIKDILESEEKIVHLIDDWGTLVAGSKGLMNLLEMNEQEFSEKLIGVNLLEVMFLPKFGVRQNVDPNFLIQDYARELARARADLNEEKCGNYFDELIERIKYTDLFEEILEQSMDHPREVTNAETRFMHFITPQGKIRARHAREQLKQNPRFELVQMFDLQVY